MRISLIRFLGEGCKMHVLRHVLFEISVGYKFITNHSLKIFNSSMMLYCFPSCELAIVQGREFSGAVVPATVPISLYQKNKAVVAHKSA